jgi:hypothetical protein
VFQKSAAGTLTGKIFSLERGTENRVEPITVTGDRIRFEVGSIKGSFEGVWEREGKEVNGMWTQPGIRLPLVLTRTDKHSAAQADFQGVDTFVPKAPTVVRAGGKEWLYYEVHITNWSDSEMTLLRLELLIGDDVEAIEGDALKRLAIAAGTKLAPGARSVILVAAAGEQFPDSVRHRVTFQVAGEVEPRTVECAKVPVTRDPWQIVAPVAGGPWIARNGPDSSMHHRGTLLNHQGRTTISQRFAFDFVHDNGEEVRSEHGDPLDNKSHLSYGAPVFAVADATVASVVDGLPDNVPDDIFPLVPLIPATMFGNRVTLDLGHDRYATYAHLQAGLQVHQGDKVRAGQLLGAIGNSGRSTAPHLHFQVTDGPDPIASEGVPFVFTSFSRDGARYSGEMPLNEWIIGFPERQ